MDLKCAFDTDKKKIQCAHLSYVAEPLLIKFPSFLDSHQAGKLELKKFRTYSINLFCELNGTNACSSFSTFIFRK